MRVPTLRRLCAAAVLALAVAVAPASAADPVANPDLSLACGSRIVLVLDESSSIHDNGATGDVRSAAMSFAQGLAGTGSKLAIVEFGTRARTPLGFTTVTTDAIGQGGAISRYVFAQPGAPEGGYDPPPSTEFGIQYTNWQDAMDEVNALNGADPAPLVVFITDGDPTAYNAPTAGDPTAVAIQQPVDGAALQLAIASANAVKRDPATGAARSHILAVGVGPGVQAPASVARLQAISGGDAPVTQMSDFDPRTTDVLMVPTYAGLDAALSQLVATICQSSVVVRKEVDSNGDGVYENGRAGWQFTATVDPAPTAWITPATLGQADLPSATTRTATTAFESSSAEFRWRNATNVPSNVTIVESQKPGYLLASVSCLRADAQGAVVERVTPQMSSANGFGLPVVAGQAWTCTVRNRVGTTARIVGNPTPTKLAIVKTGPARARAGTLVPYRVTVRNAGTVVASQVVSVDSIPVGMTYVRASIPVRVLRGSVVARLGDMAPGQARTFVITFRASRAAGLRTNIVAADALNARRVIARATTRITTVRGVRRPPTVVG